MPFVRLDDQWLENPKVAQAGTLAAHLYSAGITYSNRHLADGFVPAGILNRLCDWTGISQDGEQVTNQQLAARLVEHGLWLETKGGWMIHDYFDFQPSKAEVEAKRVTVSDKRKAAGSKGGSKAQANRVANEQQTSSKRVATGVANEQQTGSSRVAKFKPQTQTQTQTQTTEIQLHRAPISNPSTAAARRQQRTQARLALSSVPDTGGAA